MRWSYISSSGHRLVFFFQLCRHVDLNKYTETFIVRRYVYKSSETTGSSVHSLVWYIHHLWGIPVVPIGNSEIWTSALPTICARVFCSALSQLSGYNLLCPSGIGFPLIVRACYRLFFHRGADVRVRQNVTGCLSLGGTCSMWYK